jgi:1-acyl-sn-glycerol-3-phosphate acyltransferase
VALSGVVRRGRRVLETAKRFAYTGIAWVLAWTLLPTAWVAAVLLPPLSWRLRVARCVCRSFFRVMRLPLTVEGLAHVPRGETVLLVSNHASYLDPMILLAALPADFTFVVKREFENNFFTWVLMRRLCAVFVERDDVGRSSVDLGRIRSTVEHTTSIAVFPEGTFDAQPGVRPFRLGAFTVAAEAGVPLLPITIRGNRRVLRDGQWWFERGPLHVDVRPLLRPQVSGFAEAVRLRNAARRSILERLDEPDLTAGDLVPGDEGRHHEPDAFPAGTDLAPALESRGGRP